MPTMKYHYLHRCPAHQVVWERQSPLWGLESFGFRDEPFCEPKHLGVRPMLLRPGQIGSLAGAAYLLKDNAGVLRRAQCGQKPHVEHKGKCSFDCTAFSTSPRCESMA